jgi:hypothetical protein
MNKVYLNFAINQMTSLRYFIPLVIEGNKRNIQSRFFVRECGKYNCALQHIKKLVKLAEEYKFLIFPLKELINYPKEPTFFTEDQCLYESSMIPNKKYVITTMTDFISLHNKPRVPQPNPWYPGAYVNYCDHVIMLSEFVAEYYNCLSPKNLYFGSPKYDVELNEEEIYKKYDLKKHERYVLLAFPRIRDFRKMDLKKLYVFLRDLGYKIIVKTRAKDRVPYRELMGDHYFEDASWYPHTTMELIKISNFIVNFSSTTIKECVLLKRPLINFHTKPFDIPMGFLYNLDYCKNLNVELNFDEIKEAVNYLETTDLSEQYDVAIKEFLFEPKNVSKKILDFAL